MTIRGEIMVDTLHLVTNFAAIGLVASGAYLLGTFLLWIERITRAKFAERANAQEKPQR
jgi:nitrate reductase gamma subunit